MLNLTALAMQLKERTKWQETPEPVTFDNYLGITLSALKRLFIDTGRASQYDVMKLTTLEDDSYNYNDTFGIDEEEYILICAQIGFFRKVQTDVNKEVSYQTDAMTVTNADKPYANLRDTISQLENERRIIYFKMVRFTIGEG
jgi:hypothetical protein